MGEYAVVSQDVTRVNGAVTRSDTLDNQGMAASVHLAADGRRGNLPQRDSRRELRARQARPRRLGAGRRVHELSIDDDAFTGGANSFANPLTAARRAELPLSDELVPHPNVKWSIDYELTKFDGGAATGDRPDEKAYLTPHRAVVLS